MLAKPRGEESGMSRVLQLPTVVYEVVPDHFDPASGEKPLVAIRKRLDHLRALGVDGLALTPIFPASDRLRLNTTDYHAVDPALGTELDFIELCDAANAAGIQVILMGVFDHVSQTHPWFLAASSHGEDESAYPPELRTRRFFTFDDDDESYACLDADKDAPELDLRNPDVRRRLFTGEESVLHHWLNCGAGGWRVLRADAVGYSILREFRRGTLTVEGPRMLIGDIKGFADRYVKDGLLDGVVHHYQREAVISFLRSQIPARQVGRVLRDVAQGYGKTLGNGWNALSGHDVSRVGTLLGDERRTRLATILSYTLPGAAHIFYGDEVGLNANHDHLIPMRWQRSRWNEGLFDFHVLLGKLRAELPALNKGDFVDLTPEGEEEIFAFARVTRDPRETVIVVVNRASQTRVRKLFAPVTDLPDGLLLRDLLDTEGTQVSSGTITLKVRGQGASILVPDESAASSGRFFRGY